VKLVNVIQELRLVWAHAQYLPSVRVEVDDAALVHLDEAGKFRRGRRE
jgi:hypothetical protein